MAHRKSKVQTKWNSNFAYTIGVIATDGNLSPDQRHVVITSKDLEMISNCAIGLKIEMKYSKKARGGEHDKKYFVLQFSDVNFFEFLVSIGLTTNKSKTIDVLKIPEKYFKDFLRGCIDGDGCISIFKHSQSKQPQYKLRLSSASKNFLVWILSQVSKLYKISGGSIHKPKKSSVYTLVFGKYDAIKILPILYTRNSIALSRKRVIANKILAHG
ncbi:hypothetical protein A3J61_00345 [Candidatus Nomurabacteria bacterium RIFCSPHIGHO2_02_FULL_38_15]|uniref:DOD-type homing endonuclease domain-containing protein n=1 Tax=Candidatus Nomurabacteria bacterium RIFCSPHIGHO2_02_FULL_38_15 TaxID=1801752 RepID=A0A1F6VSI5_9BACT|nr:MAG: hypothetical protein A3J61_00345 [Candidatus Nomurabacteria bacterium RIFCSPHIGHO2_02_FULL_38_15]